MVENYRNKFHLQTYLLARILGAIGFVCFALFASWIFDSEFKLSEISWWRYLLLTVIGYSLSALVDKLVPFFEKQREEKNRFNAICMYAPDAISVLTLPDLRYHFVNEVAREMITHISGIENPIGMTFREVHGQTKSTQTETTFLHLLKTGTSLNKVEIRLKPKDSEKREIVCDMKAFPFRDQYGQIAGLIIYYVDVTDKVRARRGAELANAEKTEFTKRAGAEIHEAIVSAREKIELLQNNQVANADRALMYKSVVHSLNDLATMAREVTELGRIHAGEVELEPTWFSLSDATKEILAYFSHEAEAKGLRFLWPTLEGLPEVFVDRSRVVELLTTLFHTAIKLTAKGRIELRVSLEVVDHERAIFEYRVIYTGYAQDSIALNYAQKVARLLGGSLSLEHNKSSAGFVFRLRFEAEIHHQSNIVEFGPTEGASDEEISESDHDVLPPIKKTGS